MRIGRWRSTCVSSLGIWWLTSQVVNFLNEGAIHHMRNHERGGARSLPRSVGCWATSFGKQEYWESFYSGDTEDAKDFEWFCSYEDIEPFFRDFARPALEKPSPAALRPQLMIAGCGNSRLANEIYDDLSSDGIEVDIWNVDYAEAAIARARAVAGERPLKHVVADLRDLPEETFPENSFDVIVDKGTMDALFCAGGPSAQRCAEQLHKVLRPSGVMLVLSGVASSQELLQSFRDWTTILDGSPYITEEGEASINLRSRLFVFPK
ncbi:unnamed protein product [Durusdinium trenchii]|uniref:EEF1A lysine and N-terminal methyltransferase (EEF1A-KNMT) (Methyltransferase-like protein 13) n=3 Tax=Durusdinium trenchii TaxID=1381693 RepID=A0ABP0KUK0_9DINO